MFVPVSHLLAEPSLRLTALVTGPRTETDRISWVSTTELPDPLPFLRGGELVMTTGLLERTDAQWRDLIVRLARRPIAALCFGTGLVHPRVPDVVVDAAADAALTLIESPADVPFGQISRWVADQIFARHYEAVHAAVRIQDGMVRELLAGGGLRGLLRRLHAQLDAGTVAVLEPDGRLVAKHPAASRWSGHPGPAPENGEGPVELPIMLGDIPVALLRTERATRHTGLVSFAANLFGLEFARQQAVRTGRREMLGQVIEDIVLRARSEPDARRSLALHGVTADSRYRVVVAQPATGRDRLRHAPWTLDQPFASETDPMPVALVRDSVVVLLPGDRDPQPVTAGLLRRLSRIDPEVGIGVSEARAGVAGLRVGYHEGCHAARSGPGVHHAAPLSPTGLVLANLELPMADVGRAVLEPLLAHDADHGGDLIRTLRSYLEHDCQSAPTIKALIVHRNTLRYRLQLIERLTGKDLNRFKDRMELWFALAAIDLEPPEVHSAST
ncbi:PucR family transcriptional regulator [Planosporangium thailandense]|nr:PucR family transcriptional regulator ligand-binding domain-containing protein [Planosporangium thailandense]